MGYVILLLTSLVAAVTQAQFAPGCSFNDGQCMYTVQLGHQGQCDKRDVTSGGGQCCDVMQSQMTGLTSDVNTLKSQVSTLMSELTTTKSNHSEVTDKITEAERQAQQLQETLAQKEAELNTTQKELSDLIGQAGDEIRSLRATVGRLTTDLNNCRGSLGLTTNTPELPDSSIVPQEVSPLLFCDFEEQHTCGFTNDSTTYHGFQMGSGRQSSSTGPEEDHTMGNPHGHYMFTDATYVGTRSSSSNEKTLSMTSPAYPAGSGYCLRFWYTMYGRDVKQFNVYAKIGAGSGYPVFHRVGDNGQMWKMGEVDLDSEYTHSPFHLVFSATTNAYRGSYSQVYYPQGDVAVDDIYVYNVSCKNISPCPKGGITRESGGQTFCYTFHVQPATWYEAARLCRQEGATSHLVEISSQAEQDFLVQTIKGDSALSAAGQNGFFTAGNDERTEHTFEWTATGALYKGTYSNWKTGQPNNVGDDQDCLLMEYPDLDYKWGDVDCDESHPFICERQYPTPKTTPSTTPASAMVG